MKVVIAGGSGFLGQALTRALVARGHDVVVLTRTPRAQEGAVRYVAWSPEDPMPPPELGGWPRELDGVDAVVNLAGEGIADRRWNDDRKDDLRHSRTSSTRNLVAAIRAATRRPSVFLSGSGIGYYGTTDDEALDESFPPGSDFLAMLCLEWEAHAQAATALGCRVVIVRTGIVLSRDGGALKKLLLPFKLFAGGPIASGRQYMSWIHRDDWVGMVIWALEHTAVSGVINATAPTPVTNAAFSKALGRAIHRPSWLRMPAFALRMIVGEMANIALVQGQRVVPKRATALGYSFKFTDIDAAMRAATAKT